jgi:CheY-like chemotaxis protein
MHQFLMDAVGATELRSSLPPLAMGAGNTAMIVDPQQPIRRIVASFYRLAGGAMRVEEALDGASAVMALRVNIEKIGLIIADWDMSPVTGLQLVMLLRRDKDERFRRLPFLMLASGITKADLRRGMEAGVDSFLAKPFSLNTFHKAAHRALVVRQALS